MSPRCKLSTSSLDGEGTVISLDSELRTEPQKFSSFFCLCFFLLGVIFKSCFPFLLFFFLWWGGVCVFGLGAFRLGCWRLLSFFGASSVTAVYRLASEARGRLFHVTLGNIQPSLEMEFVNTLFVGGGQSTCKICIIYICSVLVLMVIQLVSSRVEISSFSVKAITFSFVKFSRGLACMI